MKLKTGVKAGENSVNLTINIAQNSGEWHSHGRLSRTA